MINVTKCQQMHAVTLVAVVVACSLVEPISHKRVADRKLKQHVAFSVQKIFASKLLMQLALLIAAIGILRGAYTEYSGILFIALGLTAIPMGYAGGAKWLVSALGQIVAPKIGRKAIGLAPLFFVTFLVFSLLQTPWTLVFFFIAGILYSIIANQAEAAIQDHTPSDIRATTLSILSFTSNVALVPLGLLFGWIAEQTNIFNAYIMIAAIGILYLISWLLVGRKTLQPLYKSKATDTGRLT